MQTRLKINDFSKIQENTTDFRRPQLYEILELENFKTYWVRLLIESSSFLVLISWYGHSEPFKPDQTYLSKPGFSVLTRLGPKILENHENP